jgi:phosphoserine phosphatase
MQENQVEHAPGRKLSGKAEKFIESVLALRPHVAVFDCDGTLWSGDGGADFFYWEIERGLLPKQIAEWALPRYRDYKAGLVDEETVCGEMVTVHHGISTATLERAVSEFFAEVIERRIFPEMRQLTHMLRDQGCELWAVSSTNEWVIREGARRFGFRDDHIIAACVSIENGCASDRLIRVPTDHGKAVAIREIVPGKVDAAFGNSMHDAAMLGVATHAFAVNPNPDLEELAGKQGWTVYHPEQ